MTYNHITPWATGVAKTPPRQTTQSTLFDLIEAVHESIEVGEEALVTPIVVHLLRSGKATFQRDLNENTWSSSSS